WSKTSVSEVPDPANTTQRIDKNARVVAVHDGLSAAALDHIDRSGSCSELGQSLWVLLSVELLHRHGVAGSGLPALEAGTHSSAVGTGTGLDLVDLDVNFTHRHPSSYRTLRRRPRRHRRQSRRQQVQQRQTCRWEPPRGSGAPPSP